MKQTITRKDGVTYERNPKKKNNDAKLYIKLPSKMVTDLNIAAKKLDTNVSQITRDAITEYLLKVEL